MTSLPLWGSIAIVSKIHNNYCYDAIAIVSVMQTNYLHRESESLKDEFLLWSLNSDSAVSLIDLLQIECHRDVDGMLSI